MTEQGSPEPRYVTLRDYLRVLRAYRLLILVLTIAGGAVALANSLTKDSVYEARASVAFQDEARDLGIVGLPAPPPQVATQVAAAQSALITRPDVLRRAKRQLKKPAAGEFATSSIETTVDPSSALVAVSVRSGDPEAAAQIADAVARAAIATSNEQTRARFATAARTLRRQLESQAANAPDETTRLFYEGELAKLDSLSRFSRSANLAQPAGVPGSPVSPNHVRDTILGMIAGLLLAIIFAFVRDTMDRRLRSSHDIQAQYELPVLGHVRDENMGRVAYIDTSSSNDSELDLEAFRILRRNLDFLEPGSVLRSIAVTSALPEEGKTTVSGSLAFVLAVAGKRTLLVECDLRRPVLAARLGIAPTPGLSEFLLGEASPQEVLRTVKFAASSSSNGAGPTGSGQEQDTKQLVCLPAGAVTPHAAELLGSERFKTFLQQVTKAYDVVIIDTSPLLPVADTLELLPQVDGVIICARELQTTRDQAVAARAALDRLPPRPTGLVVTGMRPHEGDYEIYAYGSAGYQ